jgi:Uncharacterized protein conserved in bacteria (DUF2252)
LATTASEQSRAGDTLPPKRAGDIRAGLRLDPGPSHARSGDRIAISAYLGKGERFDQAIAEFAERYADQNELDFAALVEAANRAASQRRPISTEGQQVAGRPMRRGGLGHA